MDLKCTLNTLHVAMWSGFIWLMIGPKGVFLFESGSGLWGSHKEGNLLTSCVMASYNNEE